MFVVFVKMVFCFVGFEFCENDGMIIDLKRAQSEIRIFTNQERGALCLVACRGIRNVFRPFTDCVVLSQNRESTKEK